MRKSLGIDNMEDVELLVNTFFEYQERNKQEAQLDEMEGMSGAEEGADGMAERRKQKHEEAKEGEEGIDDEGKEAPAGADEEDLSMLDLDEVVDILKEFHRRREEKANNAEMLGNPRMKKRSNFETEEQKKERIKREERIFWEKMTTVLSDSKISVWDALDKALSKYYGLLVERQNLIEETGLLN